MVPIRWDRDDLLRPQLGGVEDIEGHLGDVVLGEELDTEVPLGVLAGVDGVGEVPAVEVRVDAGELVGLGPHQGVDAERPASSGTSPASSVAGGVDQPERVDAEALHHPVTPRDRPVRHRST